MQKKMHPVQPVELLDEVLRFKKNNIVSFLLDNGPFDLNTISMMVQREEMGFTVDDYNQLMQLIGYSVSGASDLSMMTDEIIKKARKSYNRDKIKNKEYDPVICIECGGISKLVKGNEIYPDLTQIHDLYFWRCDCGAYVGCHKNNRKKTPLGSPAGEKTRKLRIQTHAFFDPIWKNKFMDRREAYRWLAQAMGMEEKKCHIGMFSAEQCEKALDILRNVFFDENGNIHHI